MRVILQRVRSAAVTVGQRQLAHIGQGWLILLGINSQDGEDDIAYLCQKSINLRAFSDPQGKMNLHIKDIDGEILVVSQFTLYGDCRKGRRPSFHEAAPPELAERLYKNFIARLRQEGVRVATGEFGAAMCVHMEGDGPVTFILDSRNR